MLADSREEGTRDDKGLTKENVLSKYSSTTSPHEYLILPDPRERGREKQKKKREKYNNRESVLLAYCQAERDKRKKVYHQNILR